jgi:hypothetical protein
VTKTTNFTALPISLGQVIYCQNYHYRTRVLCRVSQTLGKGHFTIGKAFVECYTRQRILDKYFIGKGFFAEYFFRTLSKDFDECRKALSKEKTLDKLRIAKKPKTAKHF